MPDNRVRITTAKKPKAPSPADAFRQPRQPKDIETLISNNLSKLRGTSPKGEKVFQPSPTTPKEKIEISNLVLQELRGKNYQEAKRFNPFKELKEKGFVKSADIPDDEFFDMLMQPEKPHRTPSKKSQAPPKPPNPSKQLLRRLSSSNKPKAPAPPKPPPPKAKMPEPLYSRVNKDKDCASPPPRPSRPPLRHAMSMPATHPVPELPSTSYEFEHRVTEEAEIYETLGSSNSEGSNSLKVEAEVHPPHPYDTPDELDDEDEESPPEQTPTNEVVSLREAIRGEDDGLEPLLPRRCSSIRPSVMARLETFK